MVRAIEIARQTGGNLTEVFDQIAATIRERTRAHAAIALGQAGQAAAVDDLIQILDDKRMKAVDLKVAAGGFSAGQVVEPGLYEWAALDGRLSPAPDLVVAQVVGGALEAPLRTIAENAGHDSGEVFIEVSELKGSRGRNAFTGEYSDLVKDGVIDPTDVALTALRNAVSIAGLNLTTDALITDVDDHDEPVVNAVG